MRELRTLAWPGDTHGWGARAIGIIFIAHALRYMSSPDRMPHGDGYYTWIFVRSLAFDGDIDFTNDYAICGDGWSLGVDEGGHRPANPFYFGPALFLTPVLWVLKHLIPLKASASELWKQGCGGPFVSNTGAVSVLAVVFVVWISYRLARRWYSEKACALAIVVVGLASPLDAYGSLTWYYSHVWAALGVAIALLCIVRAYEEPTRGRRWLFAGAAVGLATLMRPQEALWAIPALVCVGVHARRDTVDRVSRLATRLLFLAIGFAAVYSMQLVVYQKLYGTMFVVPQGKLYVQLGHAHPWLSLFSARSGFLYWTPLMWLPIVGAIGFVRRGALSIAIVVTMIVNFYVASSALPWTGSGTIGARVQTSLAAGLVLCAAPAIEVVLRWVARRRFATMAVLSLAVLPPLLLTWFIPTSNPAIDRPVRAPELYGDAARSPIQKLYAKIGNPCIFPASIAFRLRYHAPVSALDTLADDGMWKRHYRTLVTTDDILDFRVPPLAYWSEGFSPTEPFFGVEMKPNARFLVTLAWPWVTGLRIHARPTTSAGGKLHLRVIGFLGTVELPEASFTNEEEVDIAVPEGVFDSGINEVKVDSDPPVTLVAIKFLDQSPHDTRIRLFE